MKQRITTSLLGLIVFFLIIFGGKNIFVGVVSLLTYEMLVEMYKSLKNEMLLNIGGFVYATLVLVAIIFEQVSLGLIILMGCTIFLLMIVYFHGKLNFEKVASHAFITLYISCFFGMLIPLYVNYSVYAVLLVFVCAWMTDTGAYFFGKFLGKHKLIERVSPNKTVEGAIGGLFVAAMSCGIYCFALNKFHIQSMSGISYISFILLGAVSSICSQIGDLVASSIKRDCNIKDFGAILPGHGGILDRFDSVIFITPFIYYFLVVLM